MIKKIHRFWAGPEMPEEYKYYGTEWLALNPGWELIDWTQEQAEEQGIINRHVWDDLAIAPEGATTHDVALATQRADVLAYELVYKYGGLYVNTDIQPIKPLSELFRYDMNLQTMPMATRETNDNWVTNGVLWAPEEGMSFWADVIEHLSARYPRLKRRPMNEVTGPYLLTWVYGLRPNDLIVLDHEYFNPIYLDKVPLGKKMEFKMSDLPAKTIGVHKWGHRTNMRPQTTYTRPDDGEELLPPW
jgi:mannosyltransferase OCH1-like enzyme